MEQCLHTEPAYTKYRTICRKTPRLKVIAYDIHGIWSIDLAFVDKLADYDKYIQYLMDAVDCVSNFFGYNHCKQSMPPQLQKAFK